MSCKEKHRHSSHSHSCASHYSSLQIISATICKDTGLEVNEDKTKNKIMSRDQNAGRSHNINTDNSPFERVEESKYLATTLTNQNSTQEEIKGRVKSGNACYHSVQNLLSSSLLPKNLKIKIHKTIVLPIVLYECETWSLTLREEQSLSESV